eukprot:6760976-Pyramimonas_sp.AAC.1
MIVGALCPPAFAVVALAASAAALATGLGLPAPALLAGAIADSALACRRLVAEPAASCSASHSFLI